MNLRELEYLVAVDEERHFHRAAERCFVSQPTLSGQLKKLEEELGVQLVERSTRQVVMTEVGKVIADQARKVLAESKAIREIAQVYTDPFAGSLHVGLIPTVAPYLLPNIMTELMSAYPKQKFWLHEYQTSVLLEKLRRAELELLILALPVETDEFEEIDLYEEPFLLAAPKGMDLASRPFITLGDLSEREMLLLEEGHCLRGQALDVCFTAGATENADFHASSLETLRFMVGEGMGMTLMPQLAVERPGMGQDSIRYIRFADPQPSRRIGMLYRRGSARAESFARIADTIRDVIATSMPATT
ncbi:MAG: DNA-binding transcriptional regulator OxyR [Gammaproteobacteria bacterium]|nr:DNA-binding transcriptional regulator OxyR [Gammaproteobacteria bacterium]